MRLNFLYYLADDQWFSSLWQAAVLAVDFDFNSCSALIKSCYWDLFFSNFVDSKVSLDFHASKKWKFYSWLAR